MGAIDNWMRKHGYAKLDRYGLVLTPDDRILSTRSAVLDDGLGGKIVGWVDGDLAAMELDKWQPADMPKAAKPIARPAQPAPSAPPAQRPLPGVAPVAAAPAPAPVAIVAAPSPLPAPMPMPIPAVAMPAPEVADLPPVEEDEWEWEIAMARARAVADEVASVPAAMGFTKPTAPAPKPFSKAAPKTMPMASVALPKPEPLPAWPETEPYNEQWSEMTATETSPRVMSPLEKAIAADKKPAEKRTTVMSVAPAPSRSTVIPVPTLPVAARPGDVRPPSYARPMSPRTRMARGTGREDTVQTTVAPQAHNDETSPYITLPSEVKPQGHTHTRRAAAKQR